MAKAFSITVIVSALGFSGLKISDELSVCATSEILPPTIRRRSWSVIVCEVYGGAAEI